MYLLIGVFFILWGMGMLLKPRFFYELTEGWKNNWSGEPSPLYLFGTRFGGVMVSLVGTVSIVAFFFL